MLNSLRGLFFGASIEGYSGAEGDSVANTLRTTATDDEWLLVDDGESSPKDHTQSIKASQSQSCPESQNGASDGVVGDVFIIDTEDGWSIMPPAIFDVDSPLPLIVDPMENLFIEHASMSVYGSLRSNTSPTTQHEPTESTAGEVSPRPAPNRCVANRSECYNLRKKSMQKARSSKKQTTRKAFQRLNQTTHYPKHVRSPVSRSVFQPRK